MYISLHGKLFFDFYGLNTAFKGHVTLKYNKISSAIRHFLKIKLFYDRHNEKKSYLVKLRFREKFLFIIFCRFRVKVVDCAPSFLTHI
jgi:hypothetical protein